jgi:hypothetical protein
MVGAMAMPSQAAPPIQVQDGLVNVAVGDVNVLNNVDIGVAAQLAAQVCGVKVGPVAVLGKAVDRSGETQTVCESDQGPVTISN